MIPPCLKVYPIRKQSTAAGAIFEYRALFISNTLRAQPAVFFPHGLLPESRRFAVERVLSCNRPVSF
jgi:hypothetical protein